MKTQEKLNMTMLCDFYELTMGNGYFQTGYKDRIVYFDVFFRKVPDGGGFAITAGLEQLIDYIENLHFSEEDIAYLRGRGIFCEEFLAYLRDFRFTGDIYAIPEGTPVFPKEPLVVVRAPAIEAQLIETFTLLTINHQSLIATKANRIQRAARGRTVLEFGSRRAQGADAAIVGARAAYIGGVAGTILSYIISFGMNNMTMIVYGLNTLLMKLGINATIDLSSLMGSSDSMYYGGGMYMSDSGSGTVMSIIPIWLVLAAIGFAVVVGLLSGIVPASRAVRISALEAIRHD